MLRWNNAALRAAIAIAPYDYFRIITCHDKFYIETPLQVVLCRPSKAADHQTQRPDSHPIFTVQSTKLCVEVFLVFEDASICLRMCGCISRCAEMCGDVCRCV